VAAREEPPAGRKTGPADPRPAAGAATGWLGAAVAPARQALEGGDLDGAVLMLTLAAERLAKQAGRAPVAPDEVDRFGAFCRDLLLALPLDDPPGDVLEALAGALAALATLPARGALKLAADRAAVQFGEELGGRCNMAAGQEATAAAVWGHIFAAARRLALAPDAGVEEVARFANAADELAGRAIDAGDAAAALAHEDEACALLEEALARWPDEPRLVQQLARCRLQRGEAHVEAGRPARARTELEAAVAGFVAAAAADPDAPEPVDDAVYAARILVSQQEPEPPEAERARTLDLLLEVAPLAERVVARVDRADPRRLQAAGVQEHAAALLQARGDVEGARALYAAALETLRPASEAGDQHRLTDWQTGLALDGLARSFAELGDDRHAQVATEGAIACLTRLFAATEPGRRALRLVRELWQELARIRGRFEDAPGALAAHEEERAVLIMLHGELPDDMEVLRRLGQNAVDRGTLEVVTGDRAAALRSFEEARARLEQLLIALPDDPGALRYLVDAYRIIGLLLLNRPGGREKALQLVGRAQEIARRLRDRGELRPPYDKELIAELDTDLASLGMMAATRGDQKPRLH
jgi:tetratricopeptide (TPR) repeat protein